MTGGDPRRRASRDPRSPRLEQRILLPVRRQVAHCVATDALRDLASESRRVPRVQEVAVRRVHRARREPQFVARAGDRKRHRHGELRDVHRVRAGAAPRERSTRRARGGPRCPRRSPSQQSAKVSTMCSGAVPGQSGGLAWRSDRAAAHPTRPRHRAGVRSPPRPRRSWRARTETAGRSPDPLRARRGSTPGGCAAGRRGRGRRASGASTPRCRRSCRTSSAARGVETASSRRGPGSPRRSRGGATSPNDRGCTIGSSAAEWL